VDAAELRLRRRLRLGDAAHGIARALKASDMALPKGLLTIAERANLSSDDELQSLEAELNAAMTALSSGGTGSVVTEEQRLLAARLGVVSRVRPMRNGPQSKLQPVKSATPGSPDSWRAVGASTGAISDI
jgi:hypothetical protein